MPGAIQAASAAVAAAVATATGAAQTGAFLGVPYAAVYATAYYGTQALIYTGLSVGTAAATVPTPESAQTTLKQPIFPRRQAYGRVRLAPVGYFLWTAKGNEAGQVGPLCEGPVDGFEQKYLFDKKVEFAPGPIPGAIEGLPDGSYPYPFVKMYTRNGLFTETAYSALVTLFPGEWTNNHRGDGIATLAMTAGHGKQEDFNGRYPGGEPQPSIVTRAALVYDPRDEGQIPNDNPKAPSTWAWSDNPVLCLMHYEMVHERKCFVDAKDEDGKAILVWDQAGWDRYFAPRLQMWKDAADICDEAVPLAAGGSVKRYTLGGFWEETLASDGPRKAILDSFDGWQGQDGNGALTIYAGKYYEPTVTIGDPDILDCHVQRFTEEERSVNQVLATYTDPTTDYTTAECLPWRDEADILSAGREKTDALALPWVQNNSQARRLAKRRLALVNPPAQGWVRCDMTDAVLDALGERYINLQCSDSPTLEEGIPVQIMRAEIDLMDMAITYHWIAADPDIDEWDAATDENTNTVPEREPDEALEPPTIVSVTQFHDEGGRPRVKVIADGPLRDDLSWKLGSRVAGSTAFNEESVADLDPGTPVELDSGLLPEGPLEISVAYITGGGTTVWMVADPYEITTYSVMPLAAPTEVLAEVDGSDVDVAWRNPASASLSYLKVFRGGQDDDLEDAIDVSGELAPTGLLAAQSWTDTAPGAGSYRYWVVPYTADDVAGDAGGPAEVVVFEAETLAILSEFATPADDTRAGVINDLVAGLKADGVWPILGKFGVTAAHTSQAALIDWKDPGGTPFTTSGSPTFTTDRGFTGGASKEINCGVALNAIPNLTQNSNCAFAWVISGTTAATRGLWGRPPGPSVSAWLSSTAALRTFNSDSTPLLSNGAATVVPGLYAGNRSGPTARENYKNGALLNSDATASSVLSSDNLLFMQFSNNFADGVVFGAIGAGGSLDATKQAALYARLNTYMTAIGAA